MFGKRTIEEAREEISERAEVLTDQLRDTSDAMKYVLVAVAAVATLALVIAVTNASK